MSMRIEIRLGRRHPSGGMRLCRIGGKLEESKMGRCWGRGVDLCRRKNHDWSWLCWRKSLYRSDLGPGDLPGACVSKRPM
jgi:hypothetical protein